MEKNTQESLQLSIIMPVYNSEQYISECLDSILNIKDISYEVICIDDGSTDNSLDILLRYQYKFKNITIISIQNSGAYYARNIGLDLASGKYIQFIDSDDYIDAKYINEIIDFMDSNNLDLLSISGKIDKDGVLTTKPCFEYEHVPEYLINKPINSRQIKDIFYLFEGYICFHIFNREFILRIGNRFSDERNYTDFLFFQTALVQSERYAVFKKYVYFYRQHSGQSTKNHNSRYFSYLKINKKVFDLYFDKFGREYALRYLNYFTQFFNKQISWIDKEFQDEYTLSLSGLYEYCINKTE